MPSRGGETRHANLATLRHGLQSRSFMIAENLSLAFSALAAHGMDINGSSGSNRQLRIAGRVRQARCTLPT